MPSPAAIALQSLATWVKTSTPSTTHKLNFRIRVNRGVMGSAAFGSVNASGSLLYNPSSSQVGYLFAGLYGITTVVSETSVPKLPLPTGLFLYVSQEKGTMTDKAVVSVIHGKTSTVTGLLVLTYDAKADKFLASLGKTNVVLTIKKL